MELITKFNHYDLNYGTDVPTDYDISYYNEDEDYGLAFIFLTSDKLREFYIFFPKRLLDKKAPEDEQDVIIYEPVEIIKNERIDINDEELLEEIDKKIKQILNNM